MKTQTKEILEYLKQGNSLSPIEALERFGCFRLGARIWDLKKMGYKIESKMVGDKKRWAQYSLIPNSPPKQLSLNSKL